MSDGEFIPKFELLDYTYELPEEKIAKFPLPDRADSKLLIVNKNAIGLENKIKEDIFRNIPSILPKDAVLVINDTKVIPARLPMKKKTGGKIELLLIEPKKGSDYQIELNSIGKVEWICVVGGRKVVEGSSLEPDFENDFGLQVKILERFDNRALVEFSWSAQITFRTVLEKVGSTPLPPYLKRESTDFDKIRYQTVYANEEGSVAAPTAGLHFTKETLEKIKENGGEVVNLTLHVGLGTFKPIECDNIKNHEMHFEKFSVKISDIEKICNKIKNGNKIIAVGTTSVRTLETLYWLGAKIILNEISSGIGEFALKQWESYRIAQKTDFSAVEALEALLNFSKKEFEIEISGATQMIISPSYKFKICDSIITNFHQPHSTLILLVAAFLGKELWRDAYNYALNNDFRFLSYGDSSILF